MRTVRGKLMRVVLLTTAIALSVAGAALLTHELYVYKTTWAADLSTEAAILALSTAPALAFDDRIMAQRNLDTLKARRRITVAALYSANGRGYASFERTGEAAAPATAPAEGVRFVGRDVEFAQRLQRNGEVLGTIYLRGRYDLVGRMQTYLAIFAIVTALSMTVAYFLSRRLQRGITEPLDAIATAARGIVDRRDYSLRATKASDDEIGVVVDAFNNMLEEVQSSSLALREADRRKDEFLATLAHELRNPLAPIRHAVTILDAPDVQKHQQRWAQDVISRQVQRMALLLDDLLDVSRITRGRLQLKIETVSLASVIEAAVETSRPSIEAKQHHLAITLPQEPVLLEVDPLRVSQSISNLLTNAAKYTDAQGRIDLCASASPDGVALSVRDTGIGFDRSESSDIFEMFSQVDSAITRSEGGLGIGLALVKGLVSLHGGSVEGFSAGPGQGSEFTIRLPASVLVKGAAAMPADSGSAKDQGAPCRVLVVDDNRDGAESLAMLLELNGHTVSLAHDGRSALRIAGETRPRAIVLDIGMPDITGYEVASRIRAEPWGHEAVLIAVTGWGQNEDKAQAKAAGFDHHMTKPIDPGVLESLLRSLSDLEVRR